LGEEDVFLVGRVLLDHTGLEHEIGELHEALRRDGEVDVRAADNRMDQLGIEPGIFLLEIDLGRPNLVLVDKRHRLAQRP